MLPYRVMPDGVQEVMTTKWVFLSELARTVLKVISVTWDISPSRKPFFRCWSQPRSNPARTSEL